MKMKKIFPILLLISLLISACGSKELKKEEAKKIISEYYQLPFQTKIAIDASYKDYGWAPEKYRQLSNQGIITLTKTGGSIFFDRYQASVTESGKKYWLQNGTMKTIDEKIRLLIFKGYLIEIKDLSISSNAKQNRAEAQIILNKSDISPIQDIFDPLKEIEIKKSIYFKLFDDGWKIVEDNNSKQLFQSIVAPLHWAGGGQIIFDKTPLPEKPISSNESMKDNKIVEKKCESKNQLLGKLIDATYDMCGLRIHILTDKGEEWINLDNYAVKIDNQRLFKWSNNKIKNFIEDVDNWDLPFPSDAIEASYLNKKYIFCCTKKSLECGDDPSAKTDSCTQIFTS